jgi:hypothetical protein
MTIENYFIDEKARYGVISKAQMHTIKAGHAPRPTGHR